MADKKKMTQAGYDKLKAELDELINIKRPEIAQKIKEAKEQGDLSENAEYEAAREEQSLVESQIRQMTEMLKNVDIQKTAGSNENVEKVMLGCSVRLATEDGKEQEFTLRGSGEAAILNVERRSISNESPLGSALDGAMIGETIVVKTPAGEKQYKVLDIWVD